MNVRAELKTILETAYGQPAKATVLNELENLIIRIVANAKQEAQDEQAREVFGHMTADDL